MRLSRFFTVRKIFFLSLTAAFLLSAGFCTVLINRNDRQRAISEAKEKALILLEQNRSLLFYLRDEVRSKVLGMLQDSSRDAFDPALMSSFYGLRQVNRAFRKAGLMDHTYKMCSINARYPLDQADTYESEIIRNFNARPDLKEHHGVREIGGAPYLVVLQRGVATDESCMRCHSTPEVAPRDLVSLYGKERGFGWPVGEIVHAYSIRIPLTEAFEAADSFSMRLSVVFAAILVGLFLLMTWMGNRLIFTPLNLVRNMAGRISSSPDEHLGEEIPLPPGRELRDLVSSFNSMSKALRAEKDLMELRVTLRTSELQTTARSLADEVEEHKRARKALNDAHERLDSIIEFLPDPTFVIDIDGKVIAWNKALEELTGIRKAEMLQRGNYEYAIPFYGKRRPLLIDIALSADSEAGRKHFGYIQQDGELLFGEVHVPLIPGRRRTYLWGTASPLRDSTGKVIGAIESIRDITERKVAEDALRENEEKYRLLVENAREIIYVIQEGTIMFVNKMAEKLTGLSVTELVGRSIYDFLPREDHLDAKEHHERLLLGETPEGQDEYRMFLKEGVERWLSVNAVPIVWKGGPASLNFATDITDRKRADEERLRLEQRLQQARKAESLSRMAGAIAHHFNNMLGAIMGNLELAMTTLPRGSEERTRIAEAMKASRRAAEVSRFMLTYLGQTTRKEEPVDLAELTREACPLLGASIPANVHLKFELPRNGPVILADVMHLRQILTNLVSNGADAIAEREGEISLSIREMDVAEIEEMRLFPLEWAPKGRRYACLSVSDTGHGMDEEIQKNIFDPFFSTRFTGRGLGLSVVLGLVKACGGAIGVESRPGRGSAFRVFFPVLEQESPPAEKDGAPSPVPAEGGGPVLIVDDEPMLRDMARVMIEKMGFDVLTAADGYEAVEIFRVKKDEVFMVFLDLGMPGMNGWQTLEALRALRSDVPVVLTSGYEEAQVMGETHGERPQAFVHKPYQMADLYALFGAALHTPPSGTASG